MRSRGRISRWNDDRGFGFVTTQDGRRDVFVHVSSFVDRSRRPAVDQLVTFELGTDSEGRLQALGVASEGRSFRLPSLRSPVSRASTVSMVFLTVVAVAVLVGRLPTGVLGLYLGASSLAFLAYWRDKRAAKNDRRRTPENTLHLLGLAGGWPGALIAQSVFHHKSRKRSFQVVFWGTVILNCVALGWLFTASGAQALAAIFHTQ